MINKSRAPGTLAEHAEGRLYADYAVRDNGLLVIGHSPLATDRRPQSSEHWLKRGLVDCGGGFRMLGAVASALIFDFDGLIADTESAIYEAWAGLYSAHGQELELAEYVRCVGSTFGQFDPMAELERRLGRDLEWPPLLAAKDDAIRRGHRDLPPLPGVRTLLAEAAATGIPCAVASSSSADWVLPWLDSFGIRQAFQAVWTRDRVSDPKPAPDLFLAAAADLGLAPARCLVLEDSANGLLAARRAGSPCVIIPSPVTRGSDFTGAHHVLPTLDGVGLDHLLALGSRVEAAGGQVFV